MQTPSTTSSFSNVFIHTNIYIYVCNISQDLCLTMYIISQDRRVNHAATTAPPTKTKDQLLGSYTYPRGDRKADYPSL